MIALCLTGPRPVFGKWAERVQIFQHAYCTSDIQPMSAHDHCKVCSACIAKAWLASQSGKQALTSGCYHEPGSED